ncbi:MAG: tryptophan synthase subunit beta [Opitutales bacterium]|nr:tryptophan synthase subunit beta [Opitutales bacterium]
MEQSSQTPEHTDRFCVPNELGFYGPYGGMFVPETLMTALFEFEQVFKDAMADPVFVAEYRALLRHYVGRPTPLYHAQRLSEYCGGAQIYLKREDLLHTGAHKITNALGQVLIAKRMGKTRVIAETGAGQHGVATAAAAARFGLECVIYMGRVDMRRQALNVFRMNLFGAKVCPVDSGQKILKDAVNEAMRDWVTNVRDTHYVVGSALGTHPFPLVVREFQSIIGKELREQYKEQLGRLPDEMAACVGGGSNAMGFFYEFLDEPSVRMVGVEAGGHGIVEGQHAARFAGGRMGVFQGSLSYVLQNADGQINMTHSVSAGLDYASVGPEHAYYRDRGRIEYGYATDDEVIEALKILCEKEGILPALESTHAIAYALKRAPQMSKDQILCINVSGRGDKDVHTVMESLGIKPEDLVECE